MEYDTYADLLVTFGCRAGFMSATGDIDLPQGANGESDLAAYAQSVVEEWELGEFEWSYDEFIESKLMQKYGKEAAPLAPQMKNKYKPGASVRFVKTRVLP